MLTKVIWIGTWAILCGSAVALCANCGGFSPPPPQSPVPSPSGVPVGFHCSAADHAPPTGAKSPIAFDTGLANWPDRSEAFSKDQPIAEPSVPAKDVTAGWSAPQKRLFSSGARRRTASIVPIGGDYWNTPYPVAPSSAGPWVSSAFRAVSGALARTEGDAPVGTMTSAVFKLAGRYVRVAMGGTSDPSVGVELRVKVDGRDLSGCPATTSGWKFAKSPAPAKGLETFLPVQVWTNAKRTAGGDLERLRTQEFQLDQSACNVQGRDAIVRIVDESKSGHINVGAIELTDSPLESMPAEEVPVWGFADFHTHPTDYLSFGGLQGIHTVWGSPGGRMADYVGDPAKVRANFSHDIPPCDDPHMPFNGHHGGYSAPTMINASEGRLAASVDDLSVREVADKHGSQGGPTFTDFPDFRNGSHEQYHISQIHRAYLGGLRLISALAVHNPGLEYGMGWVRCGDEGKPTIDTTNDWVIIRAHVRAMRQLAQLNKEWMEIAYTPSDARRIIGENKLAVVLGVEVPRLGADADGEVDLQVRELEGLGVRQVTVVHGMDNLLAGSAIFQDLYNTAGDWMNRPAEHRDEVETLSGLFTWSQFPASFFEITTAPSPLETDPSESILFRLSNPERIVLSDLFPRPGRFSYNVPIINKPFGVLHTLVNTTALFTSQEGEYDKYRGGHRNQRGLTPRGAEFLERLMQHGMLVDLAHMSDKTVANVYDTIGKACAAYPLMISHAHFRALGLKVDYSDRGADFVKKTSGVVRNDILSHAPPMSTCVRDHSRCDPVVLHEAELASRHSPEAGSGSVSRGNLTNEFAITTSEVRNIGARGGAIGVFAGHGSLDTWGLVAGRDLPDGLAALPFANDCSSSSKGTAAALLFASAHMHGGGALGIASDFTMIGNTVPRFGPNACAGYLGAGASSSSGAQLLETLIAPEQYAFGAQRDAIVYSSGTRMCSLGSHSANAPECGKNEPLDPYVMGDRTYDYNVDGLAHFGLMPDLLQDVANVLRGDGHFALYPVFDSANAYIEMWERARELSGCKKNGTCPEMRPVEDAECNGKPTPRAECGDACPCSWNGGAPLQELRELDATCDLGKAIAFPVVDDWGKLGIAKAKYTQRRTDPQYHLNDVTDQGDWAVYPIEPNQTWACGNETPTLLRCPAAANYVKVRRVLDTTVSPFIERCDYQPLPPEAGNRRVVFQCLIGPPDRKATRARR